MPFRASFACLWCGASHATRGPDDLEGWAQLCPDCVGKAGDNGFLRFRLHQALAERGAASRGTSTVVGDASDLQLPERRGPDCLAALARPAQQAHVGEALDELT